MSHLDDEAVASLAVGDDDDASAVLHVAECAACADRVDDMRSLADRIGALGQNSGLLTPPDRVWEEIAKQLGDELPEASQAAAADPTTHDATADQLSVDSPDNATELELRTESADAVADPPVDLAERRAAKVSADEEAKPSRRGRRAPWLVGVAAGVVGLVAGAGIVAGVLRNPAPSGTVVAQAALQDLATEADAGSARVEVLNDGSEVLVLDTDFTDVPDAYLEVWLIDPNVEGMVSLGHLTQADEQFVIPEGFDVAAFPIVDISVEPLDGVPTHSGDSITRGVLEAQ
jgi:hypothetical protein